MIFTVLKKFYFDMWYIYWNFLQTGNLENLGLIFEKVEFCKLIIYILLWTTLV